MYCELCGYQLQFAKRPFLLSLQVSPFIYLLIILVYRILELQKIKRMAVSKTTF